MIVATTESKPTVIVAVPATPAEVAVMPAVPMAIAVTRPAAVTDAIDGAVLDHVNEVGVIACPAALKAVAVRSSEAPSGSVAALGEIAIRVIRVSVTTLLVT